MGANTFEVHSSLVSIQAYLHQIRIYVYVYDIEFSNIEFPKILFHFGLGKTYDLSVFIVSFTNMKQKQPSNF